jgi:hypothetical protein
MDCEKFDRLLMDLLYDELDDLARANALRHVDHCQHCRELFHSLRATRAVGTLPLEQPSEGFEARVMELEQLAHRRLPPTRRLARALTIASGYAMRPQLAMAALLLLMIGSSLVLLQPRPGAHSIVLVTERGVPRAEPETVVVPLPEAESPVPAVAPVPPPEPVERGAHEAKADKANGADVERAMDLASKKAEDRSYAEAMAAFHEQRHLEAQQQFDAIVEAQGPNAAAAELYAALASEAAQGCAAAIPRFDSVSARNPNSDLGHLATWHSATCRAGLGQERRATLDLQKLAAVPAYAQRAKTALGKLAAGNADAISAGNNPGEVPGAAIAGVGAGAGGEGVAEPAAAATPAEAAQFAATPEAAPRAEAPAAAGAPVAARRASRAKPATASRATAAKPAAAAPASRPPPDVTAPAKPKAAP